jgi:hypothetical protein
MHILRTYIDLVEAFGRKGVIDTPASPEPPFNLAKRAEMEKCRRYASAEAYDDAENPYYPVQSYDPATIRANAQAESDRLKAQWNHWKQLGYY